MYKLAVDLLGFKKGAKVEKSVCDGKLNCKIEQGHTMCFISEFDFNTFLSHRLIEEIQEPRWTDSDMIEFARMWANSYPEDLVPIQKELEGFRVFKGIK